MWLLSGCLLLTMPKSIPSSYVYILVLWLNQKERISLKKKCNLNTPKTASISPYLSLSPSWTKFSNWTHTCGHSQHLTVTKITKVQHRVHEKHGGKFIMQKINWTKKGPFWSTTSKLNNKHICIWGERGQFFKTSTYESENLWYSDTVASLEQCCVIYSK